MATVTRWPAGCLRSAPTHSFRHRFTPLTTIRAYASDKAPSNASYRAPGEPIDPIHSARTIVETSAPSDPINPPRSTLPPPIDLPEHGSKFSPVYWYRIGRGYAVFYKNGVKAVWQNHKAAKALNNQLLVEHDVHSVADAVAKGALTRAEFQLLARNSYDMGKLPLFGLLVLVIGEWLALLVPFIPNAVPGTCRNPKQLRGMLMAAEERRGRSFHESVDLKEDRRHIMRSGIDTVGEWALALDQAHAGRVVKMLRAHQLRHVSLSLGLHSSWWDKLRLSPPSFMIRRALRERLQYLAVDDMLLLRQGQEAARDLSRAEVHIACAERGMNVNKKKDELLREVLRMWLEEQDKDNGCGRVMVSMLFRRPDAWYHTVQEKKKLDAKTRMSHRR